MTKDAGISIRPNPNGDWPQIDPTAYVDPSAQVIGNVHIGPDVFIGPNAVIRADESDTQGKVAPITIEARCNVQDGVIIHALAGTKVTIGQRTSLAHGCIIHGPCTIGCDCFVGFRAVVYKVKLGDGVFINAGAVVQAVDLAANSLVPAGAVLVSSDDVKKLVTTTSSTNTDFAKNVINANLTLTEGYRQLNRQEQ